ncbi:MAG: tetratricopeptide repeat protein [Verrucomicrobiales bacterium]
MNRPPRYLLCGILAFSLGNLSAEAFLGDLLNFGKGKKVLSSEQLSNQENAAAPLLVKARQQESNGNRRQALSTYKSIARSYPRTEAASEALFNYGRLLEAEGDHRKAFEQYQKLVSDYPNTPHFSEAIQRQFTIAETLRKTEKKGFLGIGAPIQPSKLIEMFKFISESAPGTEFAPKALLGMGYVHTKQGETTEAIASFQSVVDAHAGTPYASEAQYQVYQLRGVKAERSNSPNADRAQVEAGLDFVNQNPEDARAQEIKAGLDSIEERSMEKKYNTGRFYEKSGKPESARVYYREVAADPGSSWAAKAQERLDALDRVPETKEKAGFFGANPLKKDEVEMRTSEDDVVPLSDE